MCTSSSDRGPVYNVLHKDPVFLTAYLTTLVRSIFYFFFHSYDHVSIVHLKKNKNGKLINIKKVEIFIFIYFYKREIKLLRKNIQKKCLITMGHHRPLSLVLLFFHLLTRVKTHNLFRVDENSLEQCCVAHIVQCCQQYCSALLHLIAG